VVEAARRDGVSLNAWVMEAVSMRLGYVEAGRGYRASPEIDTVTVAMEE
jgi:hypothetical protein